MKINLKKTWELLLRERGTGIPPEPLDIIDRNDKLNLLGVTFEILCHKPGISAPIFSLCVKFPVVPENLLRKTSLAHGDFAEPK